MDQPSKQTAPNTIIANCLSCQGLVRVPSTAPAASKVKCPHCGTTYALSEMLEQTVPELEIVADDTQPEEIIPRVDQVVIKTNEDGEKPKFVVPPQLSKGARRRSRRRSRSGRSDSGSNSSSSSPSSSSNGQSEVVVKTREAPSPSPPRRRTVQQSTSSPAWEAFKVAAGGLVALPLAYLLIFWVFRQDPLNAGPKIGSVLPFLVPAELRGQTDDNDPELKVEIDDGSDDEIIDVSPDAVPTLPIVKTPDVDSGN